MVPIQEQNVSLGDDDMADERSRTQMMRRGLKFLCATNNVDLVRDGCVEFEALVLALGRLEGLVFNSLDAFAEARDDPHFGVEKVNGRLCVFDTSLDDVPLVEESWFQIGDSQHILDSPIPDVERFAPRASRNRRSLHPFGKPYKGFAVRPWRFARNGTWKPHHPCGCTSRSIAR